MTFGIDTSVSFVVATRLDADYGTVEMRCVVNNLFTGCPWRGYAFCITLRCNIAVPFIAFAKTVGR